MGMSLGLGVSMSHSSLRKVFWVVICQCPFQGDFSCPFLVIDARSGLDMLSRYCHRVKPAVWYLMDASQKSINAVCRSTSLQVSRRPR